MPRAASAAVGAGCAGGAIGGAASALVAPLVRDGLYDGTQTVTTTDNGDGTVTQTTSYNNTAFNAITAGIATLGGGLAAGLAGANAQAGATSAENEVLNNTLSTKSVTETAQQLADKFVGWVKWTYGNPVGDMERWASQFGGLVQSGAQQTMSQSPWSLAAQGVSNGLSAIFGVGGGLPPAGPDLAPVSPGVGQLTSSVGGDTSPIAPAGTPIQSSGNSDDGLGNGGSGQGASANNATSTGSQAPTIGAFKGASQGTVDLINEVISGGEDTTEGTGVRNVTMPTGDSMNYGFAKLTEGGTPSKSINTSFGPGELSILPDGTKVIARPSSTTTGLPTVEIQRPDGRTVLEIRYPR